MDTLYTENHSLDHHSIIKQLEGVEAPSSICDMDLSFKKSCIGFLIVVHLLFAVARNDSFQSHNISTSSELGFSKEHHMINATNTKLLPTDDDDYDTDRAGWMSGGCSKESLYLTQDQTPPLPNGIPTYTLLIQNICMPDAGSGCIISDVHLSCGWFSSARLVNPNVFKRIAYDDCLVNDGNPITPGQTVFVQYANTYAYPMSISSMSCS